MKPAFIKTSAFAFFLSALLFSLSPRSDAAESLQLQVDSLDRALQEDFVAVCLFLQLKAHNQDKGCSSNIIPAVCAQNKATLAEAVDSLSESPEIAGLRRMSSSEDMRELRQALADDFRSEAGACLQVGFYGASLDDMPVVDQKKVSSDFWRDTFSIVARSVSRTATSYSEGKGGIFKVLLKLLAGAVCSSVSDTLADFFVEQDLSSNRNVCEIPHEVIRGGRLRSCLRTAASACRAAIGMVNLKGLLLSDDASQTQKFLMDLGSISLETACSKGGVSSLCGVIGAASEQILKAVRTGDNDWAQCLGISQAAACLGQTWGAGGSIFGHEPGWVNRAPAEESRVSLEGETTKECCKCMRRWYEDHWWNDPIYNNELSISVIQEGDFATGNCNYPGGRRQGSVFYTDYSRNGYKIYYKYDSCERVTVKGDRCVLSGLQ